MHAQLYGNKAYFELNVSFGECYFNISLSQWQAIRIVCIAKLSWHIFQGRFVNSFSRVLKYTVDEVGQKYINPYDIRRSVFARLFSVSITHESIRYMKVLTSSATYKFIQYYVGTVVTKYISLDTERCH